MTAISFTPVASGSEKSASFNLSGVIVRVPTAKSPLPAPSRESIWSRGTGMNTTWNRVFFTFGGYFRLTQFSNSFRNS